jgi:hypothetical protein
MDDELKFELVIGTLMLLAIMTFASCTAYQSKIENDANTEIVKCGAHPLRAKCAITTDSTMCRAVVATR